MNYNFSKWLTAILLMTTFMFSNQAFSEDPIYTGTFSSSAVSGYDTVAYFTEKKAVKGDDDLSTQYKGANWYFSSQENLLKFEKEPEKYAPQYGGYCAWAIAHNNFAKGDPKQWTVVNGKLYLNYNAAILEQWLADKETQIVNADAKWPDLIN
jgi:YHS domain-containing protein